MPRAPRIKGNDICYHIVLRCNNAEFLLRESDDFLQFLAFLRETKKKFALRIYNYVLLHSHAHLMLSTHQDHFIDEVMHNLCLNFARDFNKRHARSGHLWKNRYRCKTILSDLHAIACLRYQHKNPEKAGIVQNSEDWPWSGYNFYVSGKPNDILTEHPSYLQMADSEATRQKFYQDFVQRPLTAAENRLFERKNYANSMRLKREIRRVMTPLCPPCQNVSGS